MTNEQLESLKKPFTADEVEWRIANTNRDKTQGMAVCYVQSRAAQERFDTVLGCKNWQNHFVTVSASGSEPGAHICEISIKTPDMPEWITKSDGAGSTDIESIKGGLSGAFKRAASMWGVGRYLYAMRGTWVSVEQRGKSYIVSDTELPKLANYYNNKLMKMFGQLPEGTQPVQAAPAPRAQNTAPVRQAPPTQPPVQQSQQQQYQQPAIATPPPAVQEFYQVMNSHTTKGGHGSQTFVTLKKNSGEPLTGYIQGEAGLQNGQKLVNLQVVTKTDANIGNYNIINGYQIAA